MEWFRVHEHSFPSVASAPSPEESNDENSHPPNYTIESNRRGVEQAQPRAIPSNCSQTEAMIMPTARGFTHQSYQPEPEMETMMDEEAQLEQQLQYQREEMLQFRARPTLPRITPPSHPFQSQHAHSNHPSQPSHYGLTTNESPLLLQTPPTMHVSPFAGLALSAPSKSTMGRMNKPPVNPFGLGFSPSPSSNSFSFSMENSPRLPPINMLRSGSPHTMKNGIAGRSPILPLRSNSEPGAINQSSFTPVTSYFPSPQFDPIPSPSPPHQHSHHLPSLSSSLPTLASKSFSPSLPGLSFLHQRVLNPEPCEDISRIHDTMISSNDEEEDEERDSAMLMMRLSSSMPDTSAPRSGRVCRYMQCSNIARSRGLCRTHGGGKRCSHPLCDKSAQANRKCIAHGGGTPCSFDDCEKTAQSRGLCKAHGGGARCKYPNCPKSSQSKGFCRGHGGGIKCREQGCDKWVQKNGYCIKHGRERSLTIG